MPEDLEAKTNLSNGVNPERASDLRTAYVHTKKQRILVIDASAVNRAEVKQLLTSNDCAVIEAASTSEAFRILSDEGVDLILVDVRAPELGGSAMCSVLRKYYPTSAVPIFIVANPEDAAKEATGITAGADDFLVRPISTFAFQARVQAALRRINRADSADQLESVLLSLAQAVEARDPATGQHCQRVSFLCSALGESLGLSTGDLVTLQRGAYLHDIGKIAIPDRILFKRGPLSPDEWVIMKDHTVCGERICSGMKSLSSVLPIIRNHHERWDGSGYPDGLRHEEIPLLARIIQVADIFDALTTDRPYKPAFPMDYAIKVLRDEAQAGWRDSKLVEAFCDIVPPTKDAEVTSNTSLLALSAALGPQPEFSSLSPFRAI